MIGGCSQPHPAVQYLVANDLNTEVAPPMKTAIDSYCYHRFFGEVYPQQTTPAKNMTLEQFLHRAHELGVDGVSLESCFIPRLDNDYLSKIRELLDEYNLDRVFAWGHPDGLEGGTNQNAYHE